MQQHNNCQYQATTQQLSIPSYNTTTINTMQQHNNCQYQATTQQLSTPCNNTTTVNTKLQHNNCQYHATTQQLSIPSYSRTTINTMLQHNNCQYQATTLTSLACSPVTAIMRLVPCFMPCTSSIDNAPQWLVFNRCLYIHTTIFSIQVSPSVLTQLLILTRYNTCNTSRTLTFLHKVQ
jgi:hypothetical protein